MSTPKRIVYPTQFYVCKDKEQSNKIYFNMNKQEFSVVHYKNQISLGSSVSVTISILGAVFLRNINISLFSDQPFFWLLIFILIGAIIGKLIGDFHNRKEKSIFTKKINVKELDIARYSGLLNEQLDQAKGLLLVLVIMIILGAILYMILKELVPLLGISFFCACLVYCIVTFNLSARKNLCDSLLMKLKK
ncbi:hypothetical protein [Enterococcus gilvus]|uniref:hypothetical protein n=1 Tax=Enterococcus gilvus TaxID=160453 RepID=UPI001C8B11C8|nr:hypothetical protein [Enterococcus gilvus]MBX8935594.1 hypothetical protein [Enterococcus gilvus]